MDFSYSFKKELTQAESNFHDQLWDKQDRIYVGDDLVNKYGLGLKEHHFVIVKQGTQLVGISQMLVINGVGQIISIIVDPSYRGQGIGSKILDELLALAVKQKLFYVWLETRLDWQPAFEVYRSRGFKVTQELPVYYFGLSWVRMGKILST